MSKAINKRSLLESKYKDEIYGLAEKAGFSGFRNNSKSEVIDKLLELDEKTLDKILRKPSLWKRYHNHFYGSATVVAALLAVFFYYKPIIFPKPLSASDVSFKVYISGWHIDRQLLDEVPQSWHAKASITRMNYFEFDMNLVKDVHHPSSRGASIPQAVYKASNVTLPLFTTYRKKLINLDGLTLRISIPHRIIDAFGEKISCSFEVQAPDNWTISGSKECKYGLEVSFDKKS